MHIRAANHHSSAWLVFCVWLGIALLLSSCGGGGEGNNSNTGGNGSSLTGQVLLHDPLHADAPAAVGNLHYRINKKVSRSTDVDGKFSYKKGDKITLQLGGNNKVTVPAQQEITPAVLAAKVCAASVDPEPCIYTVTQNITRFFLSLDEDSDAGNGIYLLQEADTFSLQLSVGIDQFEDALADQLNVYARLPARLFLPSLGINTEAPQAEADEVVQPMAFVDIFRTARPFREYSCADVSYDAHGWPGVLPASCAGKSPAVIKTILLQNVSEGMIPKGQYTVLYEGDGVLAYAGYARLLSHAAATAKDPLNRDIIDISFDNALRRMDLQIVSGAVKNIRVIMPGGTCTGNPFTRVEDPVNCPAGQFQSFVDTLGADRNAIVFNPDYLRVLKDFRVIRMMNLMEASPSYAACFTNDSPPVLDQTCLLQDFNWDQRSSMDDATWGGSYLTPRVQRYGRGAPLEVQVELANQLNAHPWFNILHNATDDYVNHFAAYVKTHLKPGLKAYVEYTNEAWNGAFWATLYVRAKGKGLYTAADNPFWDGAYYYAKRASEIFQIWEDVFGGTNRLTRILGTYQAGIDLSKNMLNYNNTKDHVDALAMGAYFYACWNRGSHPSCQDTTKIPVTLSEATSLKDIFAAIDNPNDPYGLPALKTNIGAQAAVANSFNKALYVYEGGQHLVVNWGDTSIDTDRKNSLQDFFKAANRDPRMGERYTSLLTAWREAGGQQFMLYTLPQSYHRFGLFGIKEYLTQLRNSAPKYNASMKFQEQREKCWWNGC